MLVFVMSALKPSLLRLLTAHDAAGSRQIGWYGDGGTQEGERFDLGVQSQALHCQTCSSHVNGHPHSYGALGHDEEPSALADTALPTHQDPTETNF